MHTSKYIYIYIYGISHQRLEKHEDNEKQNKIKISRAVFYNDFFFFFSLALSFLILTHKVNYQKGK